MNGRENSISSANPYKKQEKSTTLTRQDCHVYLLLILVVLVAGCKTKEAPLPVFKAYPQQEMFGVDMNFTQKGLVRSQVHAKKVIQMNENDAMNLSGGVHVVFLDTLGQRSGYMDSKRAIVDENRNLFKAIDSVHVWSDESQTALDTKTLNWNPNTQHLETTDSVRITTALDTLYGVGLVADQGLHYSEIQHPIGVSYRKIPERKSRLKDTTQVRR